MSDQTRPPISDAEREVLKALWELGPSLVRDIASHLEQLEQRWSRSTVITLLQRLEKKGYVVSDRSGFAYRFRARVTRDDLARLRLDELAGELYAGNTTPLVLAFAERQNFSDDEIKQLREMIDQLESKKRKRRKKR